MPDDLKALTHINLPFIEERFAPGDMIPYERFVENAERGAELIRDKDLAISADDQISALTEGGSLSDDPDADLHPDSIIPDPNRPTLSRIVAEAQTLVDELENRGADIPAKLRALADISERSITSADAAVGGESAGTGG